MCWLYQGGFHSQNHSFCVNLAYFAQKPTQCPETMKVFWTISLNHSCMQLQNPALQPKKCMSKSYHSEEERGWWMPMWCTRLMRNNNLNLVVLVITASAQKDMKQGLDCGLRFRSLTILLPPILGLSFPGQSFSLRGPSGRQDPASKQSQAMRLFLRMDACLNLTVSSTMIRPTTV